ncbi:hypothetical protein AK812_SmicGene26270 [Symbiodinium microadriaticum]|uniref:Uncharacterized protein n=1 Tax=Symbiodinium microadriaticum TaxID=2951 RepID=A0A1Q9DA07_SYMMI|nr:hypothetical protein AK812_SmicGene26270 [Symbiodinium microadriaticum]CAE7201665.1 unnamed protein product [Symbiodinium sp. KB8]
MMTTSRLQEEEKNAQLKRRLQILEEFVDRMRTFALQNVETVPRASAASALTASALMPRSTYLEANFCNTFCEIRAGEHSKALDSMDDGQAREVGLAPPDYFRLKWTSGARRQYDAYDPRPWGGAGDHDPISPTRRKLYAMWGHPDYLVGITGTILSHLRHAPVDCWQQRNIQRSVIARA